MKRKIQNVSENTAKRQAQPWDDLKMIPPELRRATWEELCKIRERDAARDRERSLEALYAELRATDDPYRWNVLEKLSEVRNQLIRMGEIEHPCKVANVSGGAGGR